MDIWIIAQDTQVLNELEKLVISEIDAEISAPISMYIMITYKERYEYGF